MKWKQYDEWIERLGGPEIIRGGNPSTIKDFEELLRIFYPNLVGDWTTLNHWQKLRLVEFIVNGSTRIMVTH